MSPSFNIIISDTSCLILLIEIKELDLLKKFAGRVIITSTIMEELNTKLPDCLEVVCHYDNYPSKTLERFNVNSTGF